MRTSFNRRLSVITLILIIAGVGMLGRVASFQWQFDVASYLRTVASNRYSQIDDQSPARGLIYDRNMEILAANTTEYGIGVSPIYITDKEAAAAKLADAIGLDRTFVYNAVTSTAPYVPLTTELVSSEVAAKVEALNIFGVKLDPHPKRVYPEGSLAAHVIGFVGWEGEDRRGYVGVEGDYNSDLAGQKLITEDSTIPFEANANTLPPPGRDIVLTLDRRIQYIAETELQDAIARYGAVSGQVLIMDPRTGEILAMASYPTFDPNTYFSTDASLLKNPAVSDTYEPGSVFKIVTAALALRTGKIDINTWTYNDVRVYRYGGADIMNWDRAGHGSQTFPDILVRSWNVGTTTLAVEVMGGEYFYKGLKDFGVGAATGIDMEGEAPGTVKEPGIDLYWSDSDLATNSFGQGLTVTPLQMLCYANIMANGGLMMQPHIRLATIDGGRVIPSEPVPVRSPITPQIASTIRDIMVDVVARGEGASAKVPGYTVAGKTGTAQIPCPECGAAGGYDPDLHNATFVGFLPADEPRVSILIKLDKVTGFASESAAPAFAQLASRLVVVMNIPTDAERQNLKQQGGQTDQIALR
ncbi:MAG: penicillin-binding protein 2 [Anaerolineae bacterium]|nr:penicillin-binding protein 2 [Anaerolineae bacterium]